MEAAKPKLLEPVVRMEIHIPDEYMGDVMGDMNKRRGRVLGMEPDMYGDQALFVEVPEVEILKYCIDLRAMTQGKGEFQYEFIRYEEVPDLSCHPSEKETCNRIKKERELFVLT